MLSSLKSKSMRSALSAVAILVGTVAMSGPAAALTAGTIPNDATNDGLVPIYGAGTTSAVGWYGANLALIGGPATLTIEYFGHESGFDNRFAFQGVTLFNTGSGSTWGTGGIPGTPVDDATIPGVVSGLLSFWFGADQDASSVANGSNPDDSGGLAGGPNFFVTFLDLAGQPTAALFGQVVDLWFDDGGAGPDDNHDDMMIRLSIENGSINVVPLPGALPLFAGGLGLLGWLARRKRRQQLAAI